MATQTQRQSRRAATGSVFGVTTDKAAQIEAAEQRLMNAAATSRALAEAVVALTILTNHGDAELDAIAATLQTKLDAAIDGRTAAAEALKALRS